MNDKIKRFTFYNIFFICAFCCLFMVLRLRSFASEALPSGSYTINTKLFQYDHDGNGANYVQLDYGFHEYNSDRRFALYVYDIDYHPTNYINGQAARILSNMGDTINYYYYSQFHYSNGTVGELNTGTGSFNFQHENNYYIQPSNDRLGNYDISSNMRVFYNLQDAINYVVDGTLPILPYDDTLELESFKVTTWGIGNLQVLFKSRFEVTWSDSRISTVQVIIKSTGGSVSFESSSSPFKQKFEPELYVLKKGDVVHLTATPYMSDGTYGTSLYYSFIFDDNVPGSNIYRKFTNTPYSDNTLTIPYTGVSGQPQSVTAPVDGVTTQNVYKVNYNPQTYEYGDINLYEVYYSPVIVYPSDTPTEEIDETQDVINNTYTTNNYYETTKNININFDVSFGDISGSDIQHGFDDFGNFGNGFGGLLSKLSSWILALFPFLSPVVASSIVVCGGLIIGLAIIAFVLKIASVIADLIPF